jgi:predicted outer membrane repeat protein
MRLSNVSFLSFQFLFFSFLFFSFLLDLLFRLSIASSYGGVGYVLGSSFLSASGCNLSSNSGAFGGGAFLVERSSLNISNSQLSNHDSNIGGAIYAVAASINMVSSNMIGNGGLTFEGGAIYLSSSSVLETAYINFTSNKAEYGGTIATVLSTYSSTNDLFQGCKALQGSCLYAVQNSSVSFVHSRITGNHQLVSTNGMFYQDTGSLSLSGVRVFNNSFATNGVFGLYSVNAAIENSTFTDNTAIVKASLAGAIYIACTSPCNQAAHKTTTIRGSKFIDNSVNQGKGGAISVQSYPGIVIIENSEFDGNSAQNGGAINANLSPVNVSSSVFVNNSAAEGGGAIFWIYSLEYPTVVDKQSVDEGHNFASYGPFIATDLVTLNATFPLSHAQVSGKQLNTPILIYLLDYYGQVVTNSSLYSAASVTVYCSVVGGTGVVKGSSTVPSINGVANYSQIVLTGNPGESLLLSFSVPLSNIADTQHEIPLRLCIPGETTTSAGNDLFICQECGLGTYSFYPTDTQCNICPEHASCPGLNVVDVDSGYWRVDMTSANVLECPQQDLCLGGTNTSTQCSTGSSGPYCSVCNEGYTPNRSGVCYSCDDSATVAEQLVSTILFVVVILVVALVIKFRKKLIRYSTKTLNKVLKNRKFRTLRVKVKIIISFCQIVYQLGPALNIVFPNIFLAYLNYYSIFQLNLLLIPNVNCVVKANYYDELVVSTISPFVFFIIVACIIQLLVIRARRLNERNPSYTSDKATRDTITAAFLISYFVLIGVSTQVFRVFQCETFDNGESYLVADYSINCDAPNRSFYLAYGAMMILVYPIGIPLVYAIVLFSYRKKINPDWRKVIDANEKVFVSNRVIQQEKIKVRNTYPEIDNIRNLFDSFTPKRWYFELFDCARRLCLGAIPGEGLTVRLF